MIAVQEFTEGLKTSKQQPESVATIIKREVAMEESQMKVIGIRILVYFLIHTCKRMMVPLNFFYTIMLLIK